MSGWPVVDSVEFAQLGSTLKGKIAVADLQRVHDLLADRAGSIEYVLSGFVGTEGRPCLKMQIGGKLTLACQRCLGPISHRVESHREFVLMRPGEPEGDLAEEDELVEHVPADPKLDVVSWVEDEVVLALPIAPMHPEGTCRLAQPATSADRAESPFSALSTLKKNPRN